MKPNLPHKTVSIPCEEREALQKIRNKTCVPSFLWQAIAQTNAGDDTQNLLIRKSSLNRIFSDLNLLMKANYFEKIEIQDLPDRPHLCLLRLKAISPHFHQILSQPVTNLDEKPE